jgi:hypothetical protein
VDDTTPTLAGTAEPGAIVELFADATSLGTTLADNTGAWSFTAGEFLEGAYALTAIATDAAGNTSSASATVNVSIDLNDPPTANAGGPDSVAEGDSTTLDGSGSVDADGTIVSYEWDFDYDGVAFDVDATGAVPTFDAAGLDGPSQRTLALRVTDDDGASTSVTFDLIVSNVAPSIDALADDGPKNIGAPITVTVTASDPAGANDPLTYEFDFDNDAVYEVTNTTGVAQHAYGTGGAKNVNVRVTDGDGDEATATHVVQINQGVRNVGINVNVGSVNLGSNGAIAVSLFTTPEFDAAQVDVASVLFAGAAAFQSALDDLDGDGDLDRVFHFRREETNLLNAYAALLADADQTIDGVLDGEISNHQLASVMLTGRTYSGEEFQGIDDDVNVFLAGKQLREFLAALAAAGLI